MNINDKIKALQAEKSKQEIWQFPCDLPIKIMGPHNETLGNIVVDIIKQHVETFSQKNLNYKSSRNGKYLSITATVRVDNYPQVEAIFKDLNQHRENSSDITLII